MCLWNSGPGHIASVKYHQQLCSATKKYIYKNEVRRTPGWHFTYDTLLFTDLLGAEKGQITWFTALVHVSVPAGTGFYFFLLQLVAPWSWNLPPWKGLFPCRAFVHVLVDKYPKDHQRGAAPVQLCLHLCATDRLMEECFFGGVKGSLKVEASQRNLPHSLNSLQPATEEHVSSRGKSFCATPANLGLCTPFHNQLNSVSLPPLNLLSRGNAPLTDLYQQPHPCSGSLFAFVLFHRPSAEPGWGICVRFPLQRRSPNVKLVYLRSWQSFSTLRMLLWMIITWVRARGTTQRGQGQPQMVVPVEDINSGNVKTTPRTSKCGGSEILRKWDRKGVLKMAMSKS